MTMDITVGSWISWFWVDIYNPSLELRSLKLDFVSQFQTADGKISCDMVSGQDFWDNLLWDTGSFDVVSWGVEIKRIDFDFPVCTSWTFDVCAIQLDPNEQNIWTFDVVAGKANFMTLNVSPSIDCRPFSIIVFPWSRPSENFSNIWEIRFYDQSYNLQYSWIIETNQNWTWTLEDFIAAWTYYVIYKWQSHLASYLSWVAIVEWTEIILNFTTGTNLYNTQNKSISQDDGYQYQIAWDLRNILWQYDFMINWNDIAILTASWFIDAWISVLDPKNLNADSAINVSDISIIGINFELTDSYYSSNIFNW